MPSGSSSTQLGERVGRGDPLHRPASCAGSCPPSPAPPPPTAPPAGSWVRAAGDDGGGGEASLAAAGGSGPPAVPAAAVSCTSMLRPARCGRSGAPTGGPACSASPAPAASAAPAEVAAPAAAAPAAGAASSAAPRLVARRMGCHCSACCRRHAAARSALCSPAPGAPPGCGGGCGAGSGAAAAGAGAGAGGGGTTACVWASVAGMWAVRPCTRRAISSDCTHKTQQQCQPGLLGRGRSSTGGTIVKMQAGCSCVI